MIKTTLLASALTLAAMPFATPASAEFLYSFNDLNRSCQSKDQTEVRGCFMFVMGVWQGVVHGDVLGRTTPADIKNNRQPSSATTICVPDGTQFQDLAMNAIVKADKLVQQYPEYGSQPAVTVIAVALMNLYPCADSAWSKVRGKQR